MSRAILCPGSRAAHLIAAWGVACALLASSTLVQAQDLAALARKEKARRAKIASPAKVLTDQDAVAAAGMVNVTRPAASEGAAPSPTPDASSIRDEQRKIWRTRSEVLKAAVVSAQKALDQAEGEATALRSDIAPLSAAEAQDPLRLQKREARLAEMNKLIESRKAALAAARTAVSDFEDEARRAGVPAGWLR